MPRCGGSQVLQRGKQPKLRGQAAAQVLVVVKVPARGAPEREIMGERRRVQRASATRVLPLYPQHYPPPPLTPYPAATAWRRGCKAAAAHRCFSAVSSPNCEGTPPVRSLLPKYLREGRRSGRSWGNGDARRGWQVRRAPLPLRVATLRTFPPSTLCHGLEAGGGARCGGSHSRQLGKQPELRGHAAGQVPALKGPARGPPEGSRGVPVGASDPRRAADARCASPYVTPPPYATTPTRVPPSVPSRRRSLPTPASR